MAYLFFMKRKRFSLYFIIISVLQMNSIFHFGESRRRFTGSRTLQLET